MGHAGRKLAKCRQPVRLYELALGHLQLASALVDLTLQCLLHFVQLGDGQFQALTHPVERVHQFIDLLAAAGNFDRPVQLHGTDCLRAFN